jgi:uncharacterized OB-fold protein
MTTAPSTAAIRGPAIERDERSAEFFEALRREELLVRRCRACGHVGPPHAVSCSGCSSGGGLVWQRAVGTARLVTWAVVHSAPHQALADQVPYVSGYVELTEGPWLEVRLVGVDADALRSGAHLRVAFVHPVAGESYPVFGPDAARPATP